MASPGLIFADYHNHALPGMHDGPSTVEDSIALLTAMRQAGVSRVLLTPTYRPFFESVRRFKQRRAKAWNSISRHCPHDMRIQLGALVALEAECCSSPEISHLALPHTPYLLLELPLASFPDWFDYEMHLLMHRRKLKPIFAGFERCMVVYSEAEVDHLLRIPGAVYQFGMRSLEREQVQAVIAKLQKMGKTVLFGTGVHSCTCRVEDTANQLQNLRGYLGNSAYTSLLVEEFSFVNFPR